MEIRYMNPQNQIMIQDAKIVNQNYSISWLASVYHPDILVCVKSSWITYDELKKILENHCEEMRHQGNGVSSLQILTTTIKAPVDVILLPVTKNEILIPADGEECAKLQKTIKGVIKCIKKRESFLPVFSAAGHLTFVNDSLPVKRDEIVAEYMVDNLRYPVTAAMLGQTISIQIPKNSTCQPCITKNLNSKYNLTISEE